MIRHALPAVPRPLHAIPLIDRMPVNPPDPIAQGDAVARSGGQGRRQVFRMADRSAGDVRPENAGRRRSLALDRSEHDGRLPAHRDGGIRAAVPTIMAMLAACVMTAIMAVPAVADPPLTSRFTIATSTDPWAAYIAGAAKRFAIPVRWIRAVMAAESGGDPAALSPKGAIGLMQIMPKTWHELRARYRLGNNPWQPRANILAGAAYLRDLHDRYGSIAAMLAAYNAGPTRYDAHIAGGRALPAETVDYVAKVMPMIDGKAAGVLASGHRRHASWSNSPLFAGPSAVHVQDDPATSVLPSGRSSSIRRIVDLSALVPLSDGPFVRRPEVDGERR